MIDGHILDGGEQRSGPFISGSRGSTVTVNTGYDRIYLWPRVGPATPAGPHYWMEESYKKLVGVLSSQQTHLAVYITFLMLLFYSILYTIEQYYIL